MNTSMDSTRARWDGWFSIEMPKHWQVDESGDAISIFDPNGVGAITLSVLSSLIENSDCRHMALELAKRFSDQRGWSIPSSALHVSGSDAVARCTFEYVQTGDETTDYWSVSVFCKRDRAVLMSYVAAASDESSERAKRRVIYDGFRWE